MALSLPVATSLYTPENFAVLALFTSVVSVGACLRFGIALPALLAPIEGWTAICENPLWGDYAGDVRAHGLGSYIHNVLSVWR